ncbi:SIP domain-containing protein [Aminobacter sp. UC22_36]|uniref:SIP domain-containing protein n=1 Tax=Aminobacter sp. UC22_36 TaxID=3374549 RepID=UPI00375636FB
MTDLQSRAELQLQLSPDQLHKIRDRMESFDARSSDEGEAVNFRFVFGEASFVMPEGALIMRARSPHPDGLARLKDLMATAVEFYAKESQPRIVWQGDLAGRGELEQFREATVVDAMYLTPHMKRVRLKAPNLERFASFGGLHIRMLFPTAAVPDPVWPVRGDNGLVSWPDETRRPPARVYTIRRLDVAGGHFDVDFLIHEGENVGSNWASNARPGDKVGIMGPLGRPIRPADWYVMGADETGLPAIGRMLESLPVTTMGVAFIEVEDEGERQVIEHGTGIELHWLYRNGVPGGESNVLADAVMSVAWPKLGTSFGWFAAEADTARCVRDHWRSDLALGRDQTIASAYWTRGDAGTMAG